ncbi:MAG: serine protease [Solirubrobacteraceae bacterium]
MPPRRLAALLAVLALGLVAAPPAGAIVGGSTATIQEHPYQVALLSAADTTSNWHAQFCGGIIRDATHIVTAGHCVYDTPLRKGQVIRPSQVAVLAGTSTLSDSAGDTAGRLSVSQVSLNPSFDDATLDNDSAVLTLTDPLTLAPGSSEDLISPVTASDWQAVPPGDDLVVSGWGDTTGAGDYPIDLQHVTVPLVSDATCESDYAGSGQSVNGDLTVCAGDTVNGGVDSCQGDSGGPLVRAFGPATPDDYELVGIVSSGIGCAEAAYPGLYTEVAAPSVRDYITQPSPVPAPELQVAPSLSGTAAVGSTLTCSTGTWSGSPTLTIQWVRTSNGLDTAVTGIGAPATYAVQDGAVGSTLSCIVRARNDGGRAIVRSPASDTVPQPPAAAQPAPPTPGTPPPPAATTPPAAQDTNAPVAHIRTARCVRTTCTLTLTVTDAGFSAGIANVTGSVRSTYRRRCTKKGRRTTCARHRTRRFTARRTAATAFTIRLTRLPVGTQLFTLLATDKAGHRQLLPTRRTLKTRR